MCSPCHQRAQPLAQFGNSVASSPESLSWVLCPQHDLRHCPSLRQMLPKDHHVLNSTGNRRGLPLRVRLPGLPQVSWKSGKGGDDQWGNDGGNYAGQRQDRHPISPPHSIHKKNHEQQCLSLSGLGKRAPRVDEAGSSGPPPSSLQPHGLWNTGPHARGRTGLSRQRPLAARAEGGSHSHQVSGAGRQALDSSAVLACWHLHVL